MKSLLKKIIPQSAAAGVKDARNKIVLARTKNKEFDTSNLRVFPVDELNAIWSNETIARAWDEDSKLINAAYQGHHMEGGVNPGDRRAVYYLTAAMKPQKILEIGTHIGASTIHMAMAMKRFNPAGSIDSVDIIDVNDLMRGPWARAGLKDPPEDFCKKMGCAAQVSFHVSPAESFMVQSHENYDLIFLDGDHGAGAVYNEVAVALKILKPGGVILLHDYYPGGVPLYGDGMKITGPYLAMERARMENPKIETLPLRALPWATKKGSNVTTLALALQKK